MVGSLRRVAARMIAPGDVEPLSIPALVIAGRHAGSRLEAFTDGTATELGFAQATAELVGPPRIIGPMVPAIRFEMRGSIRHHGVDQFRFSVHATPELVPA